MARLQKTQKLDSATVFALYEKLKGRDGNLQSSYDKILEALDLDLSNPTYTFYKEVASRKRQWWEKETSDKDMTVNIDLLHQIIEEQRTYIGAMRSARCPLPIGLFDSAGQIEAGPTEQSGPLPGPLPPGPVGAGSDASTAGPLPGPGLQEPLPPDLSNLSGMQAAQEYSDMIERGTMHLWREWNMARQYSLLGWYTTVLGNAIGVLSWSDERKLPVFTIRSPRGFFAVPDVDDETRVSQCLFAQEVDGPSLALQYPEAAEEIGDADKLIVVDYYDKTQRLRVIQGVTKPIIQVPNPVGRVPVYIFPGILVPGIYGATAMLKAIPIMKELNRLYSLEAEVLQESVRAPIVINDPINVPEGWMLGDDAVLEVGAQGKVGKADLSNIDHNLLFQRIAEMKANLDSVLDFPSISRGDFQGSILTGKGTNSLIQPSQQRIEGRMNVINGVMEHVCEDALLLWQKKGKAVQAYGKANGSSFSVWFDPKKIDPSWVKVQVYVDSASYVDRSAEHVGMLQALRGQPQGLSLERYVELSPYTEDVQQELKRIKQNQSDLDQRQVDLQTKMMQAQQAAQPQQAILPPEQSGPLGPQVPLAPGTDNEGNAAAGNYLNAGSPENPLPATPPSASKGDPETLAALAEHFRNIKKIKGRVYLCGNSAQGDIPPLEVFCTDPNDKATIVNSFRGDDLEQIVNNQDIIFRDTMPSGGRLDVTPGTEGLNLEGDESAEAPPEPSGAPAPGGAEGGAPSTDMLAQLGAMLGGPQ